MTPRIWLATLLLAGGALQAQAADTATGKPSAAPTRSFDIAITVDDLTAHGSLPPGMSWPGVARSYLETLKAHQVPEAYGFVNALRLKDQPGSEPVLDIWRQAGYPLGNHTYSHLGLSQAPSLEDWEANVKQGEPAIAARMQGADWHYLRYPFLDAGADQARHDGALAWLKGQGYQIADVSVSFDDWAYTDTYARCLVRGDSAAIDSMKRDYLARVDAGIERMKALSMRVYGRLIPQVLLTHMGAWSAATLPEVMARLDAAGAHYVPLAQAQRDPAYHDGSPQAGNGDMMARTAREKHVDTAGLPQVPPVGKLDTMCR